MKTCSKCKVEKPKSEFYKSTRNSNGLRYACKKCVKGENLEYSRSKRGRETNKRGVLRYIQSDKGRQKQADYRANNPEKRKATSELNKAIRRGEIKRPPCSVCKTNKNVQGHHEDYSKPLSVVWLCSSHHRRRHLNEYKFVRYAYP